MIKQGLALGGGGAKGSYQLGVIKALLEYNMLKDIKVIAGTSIGAVNTLLLMGDLTIDEMLEIWRELRNEKVYKSGLNLSLKAEELYDVTQLFKQLSAKITNQTIRESKIDCYVTAAEILDDDSRLTQFNYKNMKRKVFHLNTFIQPRKAVLASSSIPGLFGPTYILGSKYVDGGMIDNYSVDPLLDKEVNILFNIPVDQFFDARPYLNEKILMIDFTSKEAFHSRLVLDLIDAMRFDEKRIKERFYYGYLVGQKVLEKLFSSNFINNDLSFNIPTRFNLVRLTPDEDRKIYNRVREEFK